MPSTSSPPDPIPTGEAITAAFAGRRVAVLGGLGFIGSAAVLRLIELGAQVTVVDGLLEGFGGDRHNLPETLPDGEIHIVDVREDGLEEILAGAEVVINTVGQVSHQRSITDPIGDLEANCRAQIHILEACRRISPPVVVYAGTRQIYGRAPELPITEAVPAAPVDINGVNKYTGEEYHRIYHEVHGLPTVRMRLTNTYGPRQSLEVGSSQGVVPTFIRRALHGEPLRVYGHGRQRRDITHVDDVIGAILAVASTSETNGHVYNLGSDRPISVGVLAEAIAAETGVQMEYIAYPDELKSIEIGDSWSSYDRLQLATGWRPRVGFASGIAATIEFYRRHPEYWRGG